VAGRLSRHVFFINEAHFQKSGGAWETWLTIDETDGGVTITADSDAFIAKGLAPIRSFSRRWLLERRFRGISSWGSLRPKR